MEGLKNCSVVLKRLPEEIINFEAKRKCVIAQRKPIDLNKRKIIKHSDLIGNSSEDSVSIS